MMTTTTLPRWRLLGGILFWRHWVVSPQPSPRLPRTFCFHHNQPRTARRLCAVDKDNMSQTKIIDETRASTGGQASSSMRRGKDSQQLIHQAQVVFLLSQSKPPIIAPSSCVLRAALYSELCALLVAS